MTASLLGDLWFWIDSAMVVSMAGLLVYSVKQYRQAPAVALAPPTEPVLVEETAAVDDEPVAVAVEPEAPPAEIEIEEVQIDPEPVAAEPSPEIEIETPTPEPEPAEVAPAAAEEPVVEADPEPETAPAQAKPAPRDIELAKKFLSGINDHMEHFEKDIEHLEDSLKKRSTSQDTRLDALEQTMNAILSKLKDSEILTEEQYLERQNENGAQEAPAAEVPAAEAPAAEAAPAEAQPEPASEKAPETPPAQEGEGGSIFTS